MKSAFYSGASGLSAYQQYMDVIANNLANVGTTGFKPNEVSFENLLSTKMYVNSAQNPLSGSGVKSVSTGINASQSSLQPTGYDLDFAIVGDGFFGTRVGDQFAYTRDGSFSITLVNDVPYLTTQSGAFVVDRTGQPIAIPAATGEAAEAGSLYDYDALSKSIGVFHFNHAGALQPVSGNGYAETEKSGKPMVMQNETSTILRQFLENSGSNMLDQMMNMISAQRAYQISARVLQTADENEQTINNLRK